MPVLYSISNCPFIFSHFLGNQSSGLPYMLSSTQGKVFLCLIYNVYHEDSFSRAWLSQELSIPRPLSPIGNAFVNILLGTSDVLGLVFTLIPHSGHQAHCRGLDCSHFPSFPTCFFSHLDAQSMGRKKSPTQPPQAQQDDGSRTSILGLCIPLFKDSCVFSTSSPAPGKFSVFLFP